MRPFIDLNETLQADTLNFYTDASANSSLGFGGIFDKEWFFGKWESGFIDQCKPSIEFLELTAVCIGVFIWEQRIKGARIIIFCDNESVVHMINNQSSKCLQCMKLIRLLTLNNLENDRRIFVRHISGKRNVLSDALSRLNLTKFFNLAPANVKKYPENLPERLWPISKIWNSKTVV